MQRIEITHTSCPGCKHQQSENHLPSSTRLQAILTWMRDEPVRAPHGRISHVNWSATHCRGERQIHVVKQWICGFHTEQLTTVAGWKPWQIPLLNKPCWYLAHPLCGKTASDLTLTLNFWPSTCCETSVFCAQERYTHYVHTECLAKRPNVALFGENWLDLSGE